MAWTKLGPGSIRRGPGRRGAGPESPFPSAIAGAAVARHSAAAIAVGRASPAALASAPPAPEPDPQPPAAQGFLATNLGSQEPSEPEDVADSFDQALDDAGKK